MTTVGEEVTAAIGLADAQAAGRAAPRRVGAGHPADPTDRPARLTAGPSSPARARRAVFGQPPRRSICTVQVVQAGSAWVSR